jgi:hypothetical protein
MWSRGIAAGSANAEAAGIVKLAAIPFLLKLPQMLAAQ